MAGGEKKPNKWLSMIRRGTSWLFAFIWAPKKPPPVSKASHKKKKKAILSEGQLWRHQHCWPFLTWDLSHKVNRSDYQLMNNTTPRLNFKERFLHCNLLMKIQQFKPTEFAYESLIYFRTYEDTRADSLAYVLIRWLKWAAETSERSLSSTGLYSFSCKRKI